MHKIESMKTGEKILENFSVLAKVHLGLPASHSSVLTNYTNHATTILLYKLRYINITSSIQHHSYFSKKASLSTKTILKHESFKQIKPSKTKTCLLTMQYAKRYGRAVLFGQDIWLFDLTFLKFMTLWGKHKRKT